VHESPNPPPIRVVIAEDQAVVRRGSALLLSMEPDMEVVGQARNGVEAVELAQALKPDVVLMDLHMPVKSGVAATREITQALPGTQILVLTTLDDDETVFEAVRAGAHAYLLKDADEAELLETVRALKRGESRLTPQIARKVMDQFRRLSADAAGGVAPLEETGAPREAARPAKAAASSEPAASEAAAARGPRAAPAGQAAPSAASGPTRPGAPVFKADALTEKEEKVLEHICEGMSNRQIANALFLAEGTVKNYVSRIMDKLHANTRTELALKSRR
jgi:DNA-binding NarL/FixJ family response regulator